MYAHACLHLFLYMFGWAWGNIIISQHCRLRPRDLAALLREFSVIYRPEDLQTLVEDLQVNGGPAKPGQIIVRAGAGAGNR